MRKRGTSADIVCTCFQTPPLIPHELQAQKVQAPKDNRIKDDFERKKYNKNGTDWVGQTKNGHCNFQPIQ